MKLLNSARFLAVMQETMKTGVAAIALSDKELFFIANSELQRHERIAYADYLDFVNVLEANNYRLPNEPNAEALEQVYLYLNAQKAKQKLEMLNAVKEGGKDYRRFCWLLERQEKQQRAEAAKEKEKAKQQKDQEKAAKMEKETVSPNNIAMPIAHVKQQNNMDLNGHEVPSAAAA